MASPPHHPVVAALCLQVRGATIQKLKDALGIPSDELAEALKERWEDCDTKFEMARAAEELELDEEVSINPRPSPTPLDPHPHPPPL